MGLEIVGGAGDCGWGWRLWKQMCHVHVCSPQMAMLPSSKQALEAELKVTQVSRKLHTQNRYTMTYTYSHIHIVTHAGHV